MKKIITLLCSVCILVVFVLAGCGNSNEHLEEPSTVEETAKSRETSKQKEVGKQKETSKQKESAKQQETSKQKEVTKQKETSKQKEPAKQSANKQEEPTTAHKHKWTKQNIHHDAVYEQVQTGTRTVTDQAAWDEQVWVQDSGAWDEVVGYRATVECTDCWATFVGEGPTGEAAHNAAAAQWLDHSFSVH